MTAKDKANKLFDKFYFAKDEDGYHSMNNYRAKQCALICVDEILKLPFENQSERNYWNEVKQEINKLYRYENILQSIRRSVRDIKIHSFRNRTK